MEKTIGKIEKKLIMQITPAHKLKSKKVKRIHIDIRIIKFLQ